MRIALILFLSFAISSADAFQEQPVRDLSRTVTSYYETVQPLKVHLSLNQPSYVAGDTIFFRAAVVTEAEQKAIDKNTILHVMLMNAEGNAVVNQKVRLANGVAMNQLVIPAAVQAGLYVLVAYHDWMKNSPPAFFFQTYVLVHGSQQFARSMPAELKFYPEGGRLVAGVDNRVVVKGPSNTIVAVSESSGQQVTTITTNENGLGSFVLKPAANASYSATVQNKSYPLPPAEKEGIALTVKQAETGERIDIAISAAQENLQRVRVALDANGKVYYNNLLKMDQGKLAVALPANELKQGVARVSVFGEKGNVLAERHVFVNAPESAKGTVALDASSFATRQKVTAKIKVIGRDDVAGTELATSVFNTTLYNQRMNSTAVSNLGFFSNTSGSLTNASFGFSPASQQWRESADMLLIASGANRAKWSDVLGKLQPAEQLSNIRFSGQIVNEKTGAIMTDTTFVTLFLQKNVVTYQTFTNKGKFDLPLYIDFFGQDEVYYRIEKRGKPVTDVRIEIVEEPALSIDWPVVTQSPAVDPVFVNARQQKLIDNAFGYARQTHDYKQVTSPHAAIEEEIFGADEEIDLEKFLVFPTMEETIREIVPMVQHRKSKNVSTIRVYFSDINRQATVGPIFIVDGVMTDDVDYFMRLKPTDVSKIKVINTREKLKTFGAIGRGGVIMVETKIKDNFNNVPRSKNSFVVHGLSAPVQKKPFDGTQFKQRIPDLRASLLWEPAVKLDENGEATFTFYTSDVTGDYSIVLDGITPAGEPLHIEGQFSVEFKSGSN